MAQLLETYIKKLRINSNDVNMAVANGSYELEVAGATSIGQTLDVGGKITGRNGLEITSDSLLKGTTTSNGKITGNNGLEINNAAATINNTLTTSGKITGNNGLEINGAKANINNALEVTGNIDADGTASFLKVNNTKLVSISNNNNKAAVNVTGSIDSESLETDKLEVKVGSNVKFAVEKDGDTDKSKVTINGGTIKGVTTTVADSYATEDNTVPTAKAVRTALTNMNVNTAISNAINNAIGALDVSSVGGSGKYISSISEADGKISATGTSFETSTTNTSTSDKTGASVGFVNQIKNDLSGLIATASSSANVGISADTYSSYFTISLSNTNNSNKTATIYMSSWNSWLEGKIKSYSP